MARLSDAEVVRLRERFAAGARQIELAEEFGVAQTAVSAIVNGRTRAAAGGPIAPPRTATRSAPAARRAATARPILTSEQVEQVRRRVEKGDPRAAVAADLGISRHTVDSIIVGRRGKPTATVKPLLDEQIRQIRAEAAQGVPQRELAERFGATQQAISQIVRRMTYRDVR